VVTGLENAPQAFLGLFGGENFGKLVVQVSET
jgi:NADPH-dependent curcumin reductase CurA